MNRDSALYALGAILLGAAGIYFHDFALTWQPVPKDIAMHTPLAYLSGVLLVAGGGALLNRKSERGGALLLAAFYALWVIALHLPLALASPKALYTWNGVAEITFIAAGGVALFASGAGAIRGVLTTAARLLAGASAIVFGCAHFYYAKETAALVPAWIPPNQHFWAYATGAGHIAAGLALVSGIRARLAATLLTGMMGSFVVLLCIPRVIATPDSHFEWCMLSVSCALTGAAWLVRKYAT
jgi:uncharacterized membrane protein YphA (DoxX/SURF4 family)